MPFGFTVKRIFFSISQLSDAQRGIECIRSSLLTRAKLVQLESIINHVFLEDFSARL